MRIRSQICWAAVPCLIATLGACTFEPRYTRPDSPIPPTWPDRAETITAQPNRPAADVGWRDFFTDPAIQRLIEIALANNRDARIAAINVRAAQEQYRIQRADLFPSIQATVSENALRIPGGVISAESAATGTGFSTGGNQGLTTRTFSAGVGFTSYEIDFLGRIRSLDHQKEEQYFSYVETQRSVQISLVAEVANAWLVVLADHELLSSTRDTLNVQRKSYELLQRGYDGGVQNALTLRQSETLVDTAKTNLAQYTRQLSLDENALVQLLGASMPPDLPAGSAIDSLILTEEVPSGLPSEVLVRRPDVLAAEHNLVAANANIGAARAAFFPSISLTGSLGTASTELSGLFKDGSRTWSFSPQINLPIFSGGRNLANLRLSSAQKDLYVAQYEKAVQVAFREAMDSLTDRTALDDQIAAQAQLQAAARDALRLSTLRFDAGVDSYLNVLDAQKSLDGARQGYINAKLARLQNLVTLYKVMGGGWAERSEKEERTSMHAQTDSR